MIAVISLLPMNETIDYLYNVEWLAMLIALGHPGTGITKIYLMLDKLYLLQRAGSRVKVYYIGYDDSSDEWHKLSDIVTTS